MIIERRWRRQVVLCLLLLTGCVSGSKQESIVWENEQAVAIVASLDLMRQVPDDSLALLISVKAASSNTKILGDAKKATTGVIFRPIIPFTRGMTYRILLGDKLITEVHIPEADPKDAPQISAIYPSDDEVPANLLKVYLAFSKPMREGEALQHVVLIKSNGDTVKNAFLDLQPELWNNDATVLTLWLDPGRIKRDLQPNQKLGAPLQKGVHYKLLIDQQWQDKRGLRLSKSSSKNFMAVGRDDKSPAPSEWILSHPSADSRQPLDVYFHEALDYSLIPGTLKITNKRGDVIAGHGVVMLEEKRYRFTPTLLWKPGDYVLHVDTRLEDLAGNNLNRPFDRDLLDSTQVVHTNNQVDLQWNIPL